TFDKLADVYLSGTMHDEDQPVHLLVADTSVCATKCREEYGNPCQHFCPAHVYEMVPDPAQEGALKLQINASNCVHCKTCDIADPTRSSPGRRRKAAVGQPTSGSDAGGPARGLPVVASRSPSPQTRRAPSRAPFSFRRAGPS